MSIYNQESYEIIEKLYTFEFMDEETAAKHKKKPNFFGISSKVNFKNHKETNIIMALKEYETMINNAKNDTRNSCIDSNNRFSDLVDQYNLTQRIGKEFDQKFQAEKIYYNRQDLKIPEQYIFVDNCFIRFFKALENCDVEKIYTSKLLMDTLVQYAETESYNFAPTLATKLCNMLLGDFSKKKLTRKFPDEELTFFMIYDYMNVLSKLAGDKIGKMENIVSVCKLSEKLVNERVQEQRPELLNAIIKSRNLDQIITCFSSPFFSHICNVFNDDINFETYKLLKNIFPEIINKILSSQNCSDDAFINLSSLVLRPEIVGFPAPKENFDFLLLASKGSINARRSVVANLAFYLQMLGAINEELPDVFNILETAFKGMPDEMCAFFCILVNKGVALQTMNTNPALADLANSSVLPDEFLFSGTLSSNTVGISKNLGSLYEKIVDNFVLSGLVSKKSHIVELTISILSETKLSSNLPSKIAPFIEKGLKTLSPGDDNRTFIKFATSFISKNQEFNECFNAYVESLEILRKYSYTICRENARHTKSNGVPEPYRKLEQTYNEFINTVQRPFNNFKEKNDIVQMSHFCHSITEILPKYRPAVSLDKYLDFEVTVSIIGDESMCDCINAENKENSMTQLIRIIGSHPKISRYIPNAIKMLFGEFKLDFSFKHVSQFADYAPELQDAINLRPLINQSIIEHINDCKNDDELTNIIAKLGIFGEPIHIEIRDRYIQEREYMLNCKSASIKKCEEIKECAPLRECEPQMDRILCKCAKDKCSKPRLLKRKCSDIRSDICSMSEEAEFSCSSTESDDEMCKAEENSYSSAYGENIQENNNKSESEYSDIEENDESEENDDEGVMDMWN